MSIEQEADNLYDSLDDVCGMAENFWGNVELSDVQDNAMRLVLRSIKNAMQLVESLPRIGEGDVSGILDLHDVVDEAMHRASELINHDKSLTRDQKLLLKAAQSNLRSAFDHIKGAANAK